MKTVAYRILEERQLYVDRKIVKKLIQILLPDGVINPSEINRVTRDILLHIRSDDKYDDWLIGTS